MQSKARRVLKSGEQFHLLYFEGFTGRQAPIQPRAGSIQMGG
jgi:hypothetical protein